MTIRCESQTFEYLCEELGKIAALESEKAELEKKLEEAEKLNNRLAECVLEEDEINNALRERLNIAVEALKEMPCMCPEALGYSKGDKCLVCTTIATIEGN